MKRFIAAVTSVAAVFALAIVVSNDSATATNANNPKATVEQNTDANGWIAVHEQGTADVNVTNTVPISGDVGISGPITGTVEANVTNTVDVAGSVDANVTNTVPVTGTVDVNDPVEVTGTVNVAGGGDGFAITDANRGFTTTGAWGESATLGTTPEFVTAVSLYTTNHPAGIQLTLDGEIVATFFAQPGAPLNISLAHPIQADGGHVLCFNTSSLCEGGHSVSGYFAP